MKNIMLMISKIEMRGEILLTSVLIISILGLLLLLILNRSQKLKYIKKMASVTLILTMLFLPFTNLLNVKAENITISVDNNTTKSDDLNSKKAIDTTGLSVSPSNDPFKAYKVLDIYYNSASNEISYDFTSAFTNFKSSTYANSNTKDFSTLTVSQYLAYGEEDANQSEFNLLVSQFAKYVKKNSITGIDLTRQGSNNAKIENIEVGSYLLLPTSNNSYTMDGVTAVNTYGALIANVIYTAGDNGWYLNNCEVQSKLNENILQGYILNCAVSNIIDAMKNLGEDGPALDGAFYKNRDYTYLLVFSGQSSYIEDSSSWNLAITLPDGINYDDIYTIDLNNMKLYPINNNKLYNDDKVAADVTKTNKTITITSPTADISGLSLVIGVKLSDTPILGTAGNIIKSQLTFGSDPYTEPVETKTISSETKITTYGLQITNKSATGDNNLSGAVFGIYTDSECTDSNKIGEVTVTDGVGNFAGIIEGNLYIKQLKAPSGYKLSNDVVKITVDTASLTSDGYFPLTATNAAAGFLPTTGGLGTILYTLIGLIIIVSGSIAFISYRKKQATN